MEFKLLGRVRTCLEKVIVLSNAKELAGASIPQASPIHPPLVGEVWPSNCSCTGRYRSRHARLFFRPTFHHTLSPGHHIRIWALKLLPRPPENIENLVLTHGSTFFYFSGFPGKCFPDFLFLNTLPLLGKGQK